MRNQIFFSILLSLIFLGAQDIFAQKTNPKRASLEIILSDNTPLQIAINGKLFKPINTKLIISDLPARINRIEVIKKCNRKEDPNCKDQIVFTGNLKMQRGKNYQAVVLVGEGKMRVADDGTLFQQLNAPQQNIQQDIQQESHSENLDEDFKSMATIKSNLSSEIKSLGERMKKINKDEDRVNAAINFVRYKKDPLTTEEAIGICSWIMYDENKLTFLEQAFTYISDPQEYSKAKMVFTLAEYKEKFNKFLQQ